MKAALIGHTAVVRETLIPISEMMTGLNPAKAPDKAQHRSRLSHDLAILTQFAGQWASNSMQMLWLIAGHEDDIDAVSRLSPVPLQIIRAERPHAVVATISGSVWLWQALILDLCSSGSQGIARNFGTQMLREFDRLGLGKYFSDYRREDMGDGTLRLTCKN